MINTTPVQLCLASINYYPLYAGPGLRFQRYASGLEQRNVKLHVLTQAITDELIARDGSIATTETNSNNWPAYEVVDDVPVHRVPLPPQNARTTYYKKLTQHCLDPKHNVNVVQLLSMNLSAIRHVYKLRRRKSGLVVT